MKIIPAGSLSRLGLSLLVSLPLLALGVSFFPFSNAQEDISDREAIKQKEIKNRHFSELLSEAQEKGSARVIVRLKTDFQNEGKLSNTARIRQRERIKKDQDEFFQKIPAQDVREKKRFNFIPFVAAEIKTETLAQMQSDPEILSIERDELAAPTLAESTQVSGATAAWSSGFSGAGQTVAILDSGVDKTHPFLIGKIVSEACYSSTYAQDGATSLCPNNMEESVDPGSGVNCPAAISGCSHGTHVAGIAAGRGTSFSGVAKDANIIAIQVFSKFDNATTCGTSPVPCVLSYASDQILALERVRALSSSMPIAAVNMSLGSGQYSSNCDAERTALKAAIDNLRSVGVATVVASGNGGNTNGISAPSCISTAVSVGSTDDGGNGTTLDAVSSFSNSSPQLNVLAPGKWINSSVPGGGFQNLSGTSMATPHVAGAFAVLKQRKPEASVTQILQALILSGQPITDARNSSIKPRIQINRALERLMAPKSAAQDYDGDGKSDIAVFRALTGSWFIQNSANNSFSATQFGTATDLIAPADYDGDGKTDIAVFRPSVGTFYRLNSSNGALAVVQFGTNGDIPVPADYDGDGKADIAVYRPSAGSWYRLNSSNNQFFGMQFGLSEDKAVPADYDGDGKTDIAVFRPSDGFWYCLNSGGGQFSATHFGISEDKPTPADYDGDGKADIAVFRPSSGNWYLLRSSQGFTQMLFGLPTDTQISNLIF